MGECQTPLPTGAGVLRGLSVAGLHGFLRGRGSCRTAEQTATDGVGLKTTPGDTLHVALNVVRDAAFDIAKAML
jgi:hypothetical protein